ncbi:uncharacterized protein VTP21DRAFT_9075 [Calcarisporiella thermophila]|uniref:uncharacterized protein n=1 Tax=Calcarisporiella thermophila TaxID=911321 RepID=UPI003742FBF1
MRRSDKKAHLNVMPSCSWLSMTIANSIGLIARFLEYDPDPSLVLVPSPGIKPSTQWLSSGALNHSANQGRPTTPFPITRGLRQGNLLSPYLYNITAKPLLAAIKCKIRGISVPGLPRSITTLAYADDLTVGVADQQDITNLYQLIDTYSRAADAKINIDKTEAVALTPAARTSIDPGCEYIPAGGAITCLGIPIYLPSAVNPTHMPEHPNEAYYTCQLSKLRQTIQSWRIRKLSLLGKRRYSAQPTERLKRACERRYNDFSLEWEHGYLILPPNLVEKITKCSAIPRQPPPPRFPLHLCHLAGAPVPEYSTRRGRHQRNGSPEPETLTPQSWPEVASTAKEWEKVWTSIQKRPTLPKHRTLRWRILVERVITYSTFPGHDPKYTRCNAPRDTIRHTFFECPKVCPLWLTHVPESQGSD